MSAFTNTGGGWLVFGIYQQKDEFEVVGVTDPEKIEHSFITTLRSNQKFNVRIDPICKKYAFDDKTVLAFYIPISAQKPVYYNKVTNTFIRTASGDQRATQAEIDAMYRDQAFGTKDRELTPYCSDFLDSKSIERYRNYLSAINTSHPYNLLSVDELLQKLQVTKEGKVTVAGLLFFGQAEKIEEMITDFRIDYLEIPGTSLDDAPERYSFRLDQQQNIFEYYFSIYPRLLQKIDIPFKMTFEGMATEELPHVQALREALVNMLMHSDYFSSSKPRVRVFTDHMEFYNPGGLPKEFNVVRESDISQPRNPLIAKMFRVIKLAETAGYGFDKIFKGWVTYVDDDPIYINSLDYVDLKLSTQKTTQKTTQKQQEIINFLMKHPKASRKEISESIENITEDGVKYNLKVLQERELIRRVGPDKGGHWEVVDEKD